MSLRNLPVAKTFDRPQNFQFDAPSDVLAKWADAPMAAAESDNSISIYDVIGHDWWEEGVTAKRIAGALRAIGKNDVVVNINSPGGDVFEGIAIYNLLRGHEAKVTVNVLGWAASAASIIAMAGDEIRVGLGAFVMIHNSWGGVVGNRHDMRDAADIFESIDGALLDIYEARTGMKRAEIEKLMDAETFMGASEAVKNGFADTISDDLDTPEASNSAPNSEIHAKRRLDAALASTNMPRSERRKLLRAAAGKQEAAEQAAMHDAGTIDVAALQRLVSTLK